MKLGFVTAILDSWNYEEMMDFASEQGFECVEVACWPQEKAERRYAGVSHIDAERVNQDDALQVLVGPLYASPFHFFVLFPQICPPSLCPA